MRSNLGLQANFTYVLPHFTLDVDLQLPGTGITPLLGHSGAGKTTLLRCLAGLERPMHGRVRVNGTIWQNETTWLPTHRRAVGFVFQEASLFAHLSVQQNIAYSRQAPRHSHLTPAKLIALLQLEPLLDRKPHQLSGGQRQRVAIARALASSPDLLLMDEPLAALDTQARDEILPFLKQLGDHTGIPVIYVTHSESEAARLSQQIIVLKNGKVSTALPP